MQLAQKAFLGARYLTNHVLQEIDILDDGTRSIPNAIYAHITPICNLDCPHCNLDREHGIKVDEMNEAQWKDSLTRMRNWLGPFKINFSGGEPFLRKDLPGILRHACSMGILAGVVTNGWWITDDLARSLVEMGLFNFNVSIDGLDKETHDGLRGDGYDRAVNALRLVHKWRTELKKDTRIVVKVTMMAPNFHQLVDIARWAKAEGFDGVLYQPVEVKYDQDRLAHLWPQDPVMARQVMQDLLDAKKAGLPILNEDDHFERMKQYFSDPEYGRSHGTCKVGVTNFFIGPNGDVVTCFYMKPVGNLLDEGPEEIWKGDEAILRRSEIRQCKRDCLLTCIETRSLADKAKLFLQIV